MYKKINFKNITLMCNTCKISYKWPYEKLDTYYLLYLLYVHIVLFLILPVVKTTQFSNILLRNEWDLYI